MPGLAIEVAKKLIAALPPDDVLALVGQQPKPKPIDVGADGKPPSFDAKAWIG